MTYIEFGAPITNTDESARVLARIQELSKQQLNLLCALGGEVYTPSDLDLTEAKVRSRLGEIQTELYTLWQRRREIEPRRRGESSRDPYNKREFDFKNEGDLVDFSF